MRLRTFLALIVGFYTLNSLASSSLQIISTTLVNSEIPSITTRWNCDESSIEIPASKFENPDGWLIRWDGSTYSPVYQGSTAGIYRWRIRSGNGFAKPTDREFNFDEIKKVLSSKLFGETEDQWKQISCKAEQSREINRLRNLVLDSNIKGLTPIFEKFNWINTDPYLAHFAIFHKKFEIANLLLNPTGSSYNYFPQAPLIVDFKLNDGTTRRYIQKTDLPSLTFLITQDMGKFAKAGLEMGMNFSMPYVPSNMWGHMDTANIDLAFNNKREFLCSSFYKSRWFSDNIKHMVDYLNEPVREQTGTIYDISTSQFLVKQIYKRELSLSAEEPVNCP